MPLTASQKAHYSARWGRTMAKWLLRHLTPKASPKWHTVDCVGSQGSESRGIVDLLALRRAHRGKGVGLKRGDLFEMVLIQSKSGSAARPSSEEIQRLRRVQTYYHARAVLLFVRDPGRPRFEVLKGNASVPLPAPRRFFK